MKALDFEYSGIRLSDLGFVICNFGGSSDTDTIIGSEITFNTVATQHGTRHHLTSVEYSDPLTFTLQICKNLCDGSGEEIDEETARDIVRWLNRKGYHKFRPICDEWSGIYLEASFNVSRIEMGGRLVGFELEGFTNAPYARAEDVVVNIDVEAGEIISIYNKSDDFGYVYPNMQITIEEDGYFEITNHMEDRTMIIKNCYKGEVITIEYPLISSSLDNEELGTQRLTKIQNDFNWIFFRLASTFKNRLNKVEVSKDSVPCNIKLTYSPAVKIWI